MGGDWGWGVVAMSSGYTANCKAACIYAPAHEGIVLGSSTVTVLVYP